MKYVIAIFLSLQVYAQKSYLFSAKGFTNIKSEKILLIQPFSKAFRLSEDRYQHEFPLKSDGTFSFTGTLQNPTCFVLITEDDVSEPFFLDNVKNQNIDYIENIDSTKVLRIIGSQSNDCLLYTSRCV